MAGSISWKIWRSARNTRGASRKSIVPVIMAFVDSGALYTISVSAFLMTYLTRSLNYYCAEVIVVPIIVSSTHKSRRTDLTELINGFLSDRAYLSA
jgi:hypothetical protein